MVKSKMPNLPFEKQLLITLTRTSLTEEDLRRAREILQEPLDWDYILQASLRNGVAGLLYSHLQHFNGQIPDIVNERLAKFSHMAAFYNLRYYNELKNVLAQFNKSQIRVVIVKGSLLTTQVYKNIALRSMADIDLLIQEQDFWQAHEILSRQGFSPGDNFIGEWTASGSTPFSKPGSGLKIDLHWNLARNTNPFHMDVDQVWTRCRRVDIDTDTAYMLSPEDMIISSCMHTLFNHCFNIGLKAFCDLAEIITFYQCEINWSDLTTRAIKYKVSFMVYTALTLTQRIKSGIIPPEVFNHLERYCSKTQLKWLKRAGDEILFARDSSLIDTLVHLKMITNTKDKIKLLRLIFFPTGTELACLHSFSPEDKAKYFHYLLVNWANCFRKLISKTIFVIM